MYMRKNSKSFQLYIDEYYTEICRFLQIDEILPIFTSGKGAL